MRSALAGTQVQNSRPSSLLHQGILATAVPINHGSTILGAVRITQAVSAIHAAVRQTIIVLGLIGLVVLALGLSAGAFIAGQVARPLRRLERVAGQIAAGDMTARAAVEGSSEQRSLGESFNEMTDRIVRLLDSQRAFVADASHQLRTPLTGLRLRLDEARASGVSGDAARELDAAAAEVDRFAQIIDELLVLSRAGERELPGERIDLDDVAAQAVNRWRKIADERESPSSTFATARAASCGARRRTWSARSTRWSRTRCATPARFHGDDRGAAGRHRRSRWRSRPGRGRARARLRAFPSWPAGRAGPPGTGLGSRSHASSRAGGVATSRSDSRPAVARVAALRLRTPP